MHLLIRSVLFSQYLLCCHFEETYTLVTLPQDCLSSEIQFSWKRTYPFHNPQNCLQVHITESITLIGFGEHEEVEVLAPFKRVRNKIHENRTYSLWSFWGSTNLGCQDITWKVKDSLLLLVVLIVIEKVLDFEANTYHIWVSSFVTLSRWPNGCQLWVCPRARKVSTASFGQSTRSPSFQLWWISWFHNISKCWIKAVSSF